MGIMNKAMTGMIEALPAEEREDLMLEMMPMCSDMMKDNPDMQECCGSMMKEMMPHCEEMMAAMAPEEAEGDDE